MSNPTHTGDHDRAGGSFAWLGNPVQKVRCAFYQDALREAAQSLDVFQAVCEELLQTTELCLASKAPSNLEKWDPLIYYRSAQRLLFELCEHDSAHADRRRAILFILLEEYIVPESPLDCFAMVSAAQFGPRASVLAPNVRELIDISGRYASPEDAASISSAVDFLILTEMSPAVLSQAAEHVETIYSASNAFVAACLAHDVEILSQRQRLDQDGFERWLSDRVLQKRTDESECVWRLYQDRLASLLAGPGAGTLPIREIVVSTFEKARKSEDAEVRGITAEIVAASSALPEQVSLGRERSSLAPELLLLALTERDRISSKRFNAVSRIFE